MISSFKTVAEKIIKTDEVLAIVGEKKQQLKKANNKIKILKEKNLELQKWKTNYDKVQNNLYLWIDKYTELEKKYNELNTEKSNAEGLVQKKVKTIKNLESKLEELQAKIKENEGSKCSSPIKRRFKSPIKTPTKEDKPPNNITKAVNLQCIENKNEITIASAANALPCLDDDSDFPVESLRKPTCNISKDAACQTVDTIITPPCLSNSNQVENSSQNCQNVSESSSSTVNSQKSTSYTKLSLRRNANNKHIRVRINVMNCLLKKIDGATSGIKYFNKKQTYKALRSTNKNIRKEIPSLYKTKGDLIDKFLRKLSTRIIFLVKYVRYIRRKQMYQKQFNVKYWSDNSKHIKSEDNSYNEEFSALFENEITEQNLGDILEEMIDYPRVVSPMSAVSELSNTNSLQSIKTNNGAINEINCTDSSTQTNQTSKQNTFVQTEKSVSGEVGTQTVSIVTSEAGMQTENLNLKTNQKINNLMKINRRQKLLFLKKLKVLNRKLEIERSLNIRKKNASSGGFNNSPGQNVPLCPNHISACTTKNICCGNYNECSAICSKLLQCYCHISNNLHSACYFANQRYHQNHTLPCSHGNCTNFEQNCHCCNFNRSHDCNCRNFKNKVPVNTDRTVSQPNFRHIAVQTDREIFSTNSSKNLFNKSSTTKTELCKRYFGSDTESTDTEEFVPIKRLKTSSSSEDSTDESCRDCVDNQKSIKMRQKVQILAELDLKNQKNSIPTENKKNFSADSISKDKPDNEKQINTNSQCRNIKITNQTFGSSGSVPKNINIVSKQKAISTIKKSLPKESDKVLKMWGRGKKMASVKTLESTEKESIKTENIVKENTPVEATDLQKDQPLMGSVDVTQIPNELDTKEEVKEEQIVEPYNQESSQKDLIKNCLQTNRSISSDFDIIPRFCSQKLNTLEQGCGMPQHGGDITNENIPIQKDELFMTSMEISQEQKEVEPREVKDEFNQENLAENCLEIDKSNIMTQQKAISAIKKPVIKESEKVFNFWGQGKKKAISDMGGQRGNVLELNCDAVTVSASAQKAELSTNFKDVTPEQKEVKGELNQENLVEKCMTQQKAISAIKKPVIKESEKVFNFWGQGKKMVRMVTLKEVTNESNQENLAGSPIEINESNSSATNIMTQQKAISTTKESEKVLNFRGWGKRLATSNTVGQKGKVSAPNCENISAQKDKLFVKSVEVTSEKKEIETRKINDELNQENLAKNCSEIGESNSSTINITSQQKAILTTKQSEKVFNFRGRGKKMVTPNMAQQREKVSESNCENLPVQKDELFANSKDITPEQKEVETNGVKDELDQENLTENSREIARNAKECIENVNVKTDENVTPSTSIDVSPKKVKKNSVELLNSILKDFIDGDFKDENVIETAEKLSNFNKTLFVRALIREIYDDESTTLSLEYTPPAPPLTVLQQKSVALIGYMQREENSKIQALFLKELRQEIINSGNDVQSVERCTRMFITICRLRRDIVKARLLLCTVIYKHYFKALTIAYTALTCWPEILPHFKEDNDDVLVETIVYSLLSNNCKVNGYNKRPLTEMLLHFYNYKQKTANQLATFLIQRFKETNDHNVSYAIFLYCAHLSDESIHRIVKMLLQIIDEYEQKVRLKQLDNSNKIDLEYLTMRTLNLVEHLIHRHKWSEKEFIIKEISKSFYNLNLTCGGVLAGQELNIDKAFGKYVANQSSKRKLRKRKRKI